MRQGYSIFSSIYLEKHVHTLHTLLYFILNFVVFGKSIRSCLLISGVCVVYTTLRREQNNFVAPPKHTSGVAGS